MNVIQIAKFYIISFKKYKITGIEISYFEVTNFNIFLPVFFNNGYSLKFHLAKEFLIIWLQGYVYDSIIQNIIINIYL